MLVAWNVVGGEGAVLAAYDVLSDIAAAEPSNALASSRLAIASFPTEADGTNGWSKRVDWLDVSPAKRSSVATSMMFARKSWGQTPYNAAFTAGSSLFSGTNAGEKARVAVLVTDGEATDRNPSAVEQKAAALRASGVTVFTVFYNGGVNAAQRAEKHTAMMKSFDANSVSSSGKHWYDESKYNNFDSYIRSILGGNGEAGLAAKVATSKTVVEVSDAAKLKGAFLSIIKKTIRCEAQ